MGCMTKIGSSSLFKDANYSRASKNGHVCCIMCVLLQHLWQHKRLPEYERFLAVEPVNKIVAPMYRSRDMLPKWFSMFDELHSNVRLPPLSHRTRYAAPVQLTEAGKPKVAPKVPFDPKKISNMCTAVRSILTKSADVARSASSSVIAEHLSSSTVAVTSFQDTCTAVNNMTSSGSMLQSRLSSTADIVPSTSATPSNVLILTTDQLGQLGCFNAGIMPVGMTSNTTQLDSTLLHYEQSALPCRVSATLSSSVGSCRVSASLNDSQPGTTAVTSSPNLIGRAFASAVGISIDQLSSLGDLEADDSRWDFPPAVSSQVTAASASVRTEVVDTNIATVQVSEQSVTPSAPIVDVSLSDFFSCEDSSSATVSGSKDIFAKCDVDVSALDITMLNSSLSPCPLPPPCDHQINNDSTLATPQKVGRRSDDAGENLTFAGATICTSDGAPMFPVATSSTAGANDGQYPIACQYSEVGISGEPSPLLGNLVPTTCTDAVGSATVMSTLSGSDCVSFINSAPVSSPAHGLALLSFTSHQMFDTSGLSDVQVSSAVSLSSSTPHLADPLAMSLPSSPLQQTKQIRMRHMRSPSKYVSSSHRLILPRGQQSVSSSFLSMPKPKKSKVYAKTLPVIAPKAVIAAKSYLSPVKQVAASITARAKRIQNSPSRNVWYSMPRLKTAESASCSVRPPTRPALNPSGVWALNDDDDEAASVEGEEQVTDVDSQLEDECEEDAATAQSPSLYVLLLLHIHL